MKVILILNEEAMIYNFRFDRLNTIEIRQQVQQSKLLLQGWGGGEQGDLSITSTDFVSRCRDFYRMQNTRVPTNLMKIRSFKDGDILVTPHLPENGKLSLHIIDGNFPTCYNYLNSDSHHLNHQIRIKESFGLDGNISVHNLRLSSWYAKLRWMRLPILNIDRFERGFREIIDELRTQPQMKFGASGVDQCLLEWRKEFLASLREKLQGISPSGGNMSFEKVCERLLVSDGYRVVDKNVFDGTGGDIDLRCERDAPDSCLFETERRVLLVQVKKYQGTTGPNAVEQLLRMGEQDADYCVMSLGDDFSDEAIELAKKHQVKLMNGEEICGLLLDYLAGQVSGT